MSKTGERYKHNLVPTRRDALKLSVGLTGVSVLGSIPSSAQTSLQDALLFHHRMDKFNEDGKIPDASGNGIVGHPDDEHSTDANLEFVEDETRGTVLQFRGQETDADDGAYNVHHEDVPNSLERGEPITTSVWAKPTDLEGWQTIFSGALGCVIDIRYGNLRARFWDGGNEFKVDVDASTYLTAGEWNHIITSVAPGEEARLFVNGELVGTESVDENQGYRSVYKAQGVGMAPHGMDPFGGRLDDLRFYVGTSVSETTAESMYESQQAGEEQDTEQQLSPNLTVSLSTPSEVDPQSSFDISGTVENTGEAEASGGATLSVDDETIDSVDVIGASQLVTLRGAVASGEAGSSHTVIIKSPDGGSETQTVFVEGSSGGERDDDGNDDGSTDDGSEQSDDGSADGNAQGEDSSTTEGDGSSVNVDVPGFGIPSTLTAIGSAGYMIKRRLTEDKD